jgi:predicted GNAT superfamily acetyltransferase
MIVYRVLHTPAEMEAVVDLEIFVWGSSPRGAVPSALLIALAHHGGHVLGAFDGETLIGFSAAFHGHDGETDTLWSHMAAVHPNYQSQGIGFQIKQEQRMWALANGYTRMGWTFDPMQPRNAKFNLRQLGATCWRYLPNYYGMMQDALNAGAVTLPSDRLEATWLIDTPRVQSLADGQPPVPANGKTFMLERGNDNRPVVTSVAWDEPGYCIELPLETSILRRNDPTQFLVWQRHLRESMAEAFTHGYRATDFVIEIGRGWYVVEKTD